MGANTKIEWATHTFNPWIGCTRVSAACDHCYAEAYARRIGKASLWQGGRQRTSAANWKLPLKWNREAAASGTRPRVFCASLADVFDNQVAEEWRTDLWRLIIECKSLDWLLLTKRPQNIAKMLPHPDHYYAGDRWPLPNVWLGTTVENQTEADRRIPHLLAVPARVHFLSCEPLLGPIDLIQFLYRQVKPSEMPGDALNDAPGADEYYLARKNVWCICGGESGPHARPMHPDWARSLRDQCAAAGVPFHFKQWGEHYPERFVERGKDGEIWREGPAGQRHWRPDELNAANPPEFWIAKVGKKAAGRLLDGRTHDDFPEGELK